MTRGGFIDAIIRRQLKKAARRSFPTAPERVQVLLGGTGSPQWIAGVAQSCALISVGGRMFVFDAGEGATTSLAAAHVPLDRIEKVFITHYHSDHFNGLGTLLNAGWIQGRSKPLDVVGPVGTACIVDALNAAYAIDTGFRASDMPDLEKARSAATGSPREIVAPVGERQVRVCDEDGITIDAHLVDHDPARPAFGYVIEYSGKKVFISGDTKVIPATVSAMRDADVVVHEAYATHLIRRSLPVMRRLGLTRQADTTERTIAYHADTVELAEQAQEAGVQHLVLTHLTPYPANVVGRWMFVRGMRPVSRQTHHRPGPTGHHTVIPPRPTVAAAGRGH